MREVMLKQPLNGVKSVKFKREKVVEVGELHQDEVLVASKQPLVEVYE